MSMISYNRVNSTFGCIEYGDIAKKTYNIKGSVICMNKLEGFTWINIKVI